MAENRWFRRLLAGTRGQVAQRLRDAPATIAELVDALGLSANAVRSHLAALERDGLVEVAIQRQGVGKPAHLYRLTVDANSLGPKAYDLVLGTVLDVARDGDPASYAALLDAVADRLAGSPTRSTSVSGRIAAARSLLATLGAEVAVESDADGVEFRGTNCPLASVVGAHPDLCRVVANALARQLGAPVTECCDRNAALPHCCFRAELPNAA